MTKSPGLTTATEVKLSARKMFALLAPLVSSRGEKYRHHDRSGPGRQLDGDFDVYLRVDDANIYAFLPPTVTATAVLSVPKLLP